MPKYKTLDGMTEQEFRRVIKVYKLEEKVKYLDQKTIDKFSFYDNKVHLLQHKARIEAAAASIPGFVLDIVQSILTKLISQKMNWGLLGAFCVYSQLLKLMIPPLFALITPGSALAIGVAIVIYVSWMVTCAALLTLLNGHAQLQMKLDELCETVDDLDNRDDRRYPTQDAQGNYQYDVSLGTVGEKIYQTMTYGESTWLLFSKYTKYRIENDDSHENKYGYVLVDNSHTDEDSDSDEEGAICKRWDLDGDVVNSYRP